MDQFDKIIAEARQALEQATDLAALQQIRAEFLGKKSQLTAHLKNLGAMSAVQRKQAGEKINQAKQQVQQLVQQKATSLKDAALAIQLAEEAVDVTLPGRAQSAGSLHPVVKTQQRIESFFGSIGFSVAIGPEIEDQFHNFEALNIPAHHPAREMQDTFYFPNGDVLRSHTSSVQIRYMENNQPPLRIISPGRVYRSDSDQTHTPMFNQIEGLMIDQHASFANLKSILQMFMHNFFEQEVEMRLRPSYFPFTEPSAEVDIRLTDAKHPLSGQWLEVLGCGMVHPQVLQAVNIDSEKYMGWAFGCGMDRLAMLRYGISDLRLMFDSDIRFLQQFSSCCTT